MRSLASVLTGAGLVLLVACTDQPTEPRQPSPPVESDRANAVTPPGCPTPGQISLQIARLVRGPGHLLIAEAKFALVVAALAKNDQAKARRMMFSLLDFILDKYQAGQLRGGQSTSTQNRLVTLINGLYCSVGLPAPSVPLSALGDDGAIGVVEPGSGTTTIVNTPATVGAQVPAGAAPTTTLITVTRLPNTPGPLNTRLDQYPAYYEVTTSPPVTFTQDVIIGICQVDEFLPQNFDRLKVGHNLGTTGFELLPRVTATFLNPTNCNSLIGAVNRGAGVFDLVMRGMNRFATAVLLPEYAHAGTLGACCLGGSVKTFSPFGAVDTLVIAGAVSPTSIVGEPETYVPNALRPSIRVLTPTGVPVEGLTVTFSAASGDSIHSPVQLTDVNGVATVGAWFLTLPGPDTVFATVTPPHPGSGVQGSPVVFSALLASTPPIPFGSAGWFFRQISNLDPVPSQWTTIAPTVANGWSPGIAPFGSANVSGCGTSPAATAWAVNTTMLLRRDVFVPLGTGSMTIEVLIDNDVHVFVNGSDVSGGLQMHEGCANLHPRSFTINGPDSEGPLLPGEVNQIFIRGVDRGVQSYVDSRITLSP
jgi:hypothetical protein